MKFFSPRISSLALLPSFALSIAPQALGSKGRENREVLIASVEGDVRISNGKDHHPDLNTPWQEALGGELVAEGSALATGNGRAEVEFENGSTVYLGENSLLLFKELTATGDRFRSRVALATGTATFSFEPSAKESFFIDTPTVHWSFPRPRNSLLAWMLTSMPRPSPPRATTVNASLGAMVVTFSC